MINIPRAMPMQLKVIKMSSFQDFGLRDEIMKAIERMGFVEPTPVQVADHPPHHEGEGRHSPGPDRHGQDGGLRHTDP